MPALDVDVAVPAFDSTVLDVPALPEGRYEFTCGMGMRHGALEVGDPPSTDTGTHPGSTGQGSPPPVAVSPPVAPEEDAEERERAAEIRDLRNRVLLGAILTLPVVFAVMAEELFGATWVPPLLMNDFFQLALITPVFFYTGWPIHKTGWIALSHRTADMNSLITLGTIAAYGYSLVVTFAPGAAARGDPAGLLRGRRGHHHPHPAGPAVGDQGQGRHR